MRVFDILFSLVGMILLSPLLGLTILLLLVTGEKKVFYTQERVGQYFRLFKVIKFVTMISGSANIGSGTITLSDDPRVLPLGKFLRKTKINELPQLYNVLIGDMSLIGPRPLTPETFEYYEHNIRSIICEIRPGLSGIGSVLFRNEESLLHDPIRAKIIYKEQIAPKKAIVEKWYVENYGILNYILIIIFTIQVVLFPRSTLNKKYLRGLPKI